MPEKSQSRGATQSRGAAQTTRAARSGTEPSGEVLAGISSGMVRLYREHFGKGPTKAKTYALDDLVICVMRDGLSPAEKTLYEAGRASTVREMRAAYLDAVADSFKGVVEGLTGRRVTAFMSQTNVGPDLVVQVFFLDGPIVENGTLEADGDGNHA
jgi:uncharacterized protein YbcI